jgi:hypothetical protein
MAASQRDDARTIQQAVVNVFVRSDAVINVFDHDFCRVHADFSKTQLEQFQCVPFFVRVVVQIRQ